MTLDAGAYSVSASGPAGYAQHLSADCAGTIAAGETQDLHDHAATISRARSIVVTEVVNDNGGSAVPGDFTITVNGGNPSPASFPGRASGHDRAARRRAATPFSVTGPAGYTSTLSRRLRGHDRHDESRTCTITHDDRPPTVPTCDGKVATIVGTPGLTELLGTSGDDVIVDLDGDNVVRGRGGNDTVCTGPGNDRIFLGGGADTVIDTGGRNTIEGGAGSDSSRPVPATITSTPAAATIRLWPAMEPTWSTGRPATTRSGREPATIGSTAALASTRAGPARGPTSSGGASSSSDSRRRGCRVELGSHAHQVRWIEPPPEPVTS